MSILKSLRMGLVAVGLVLPGATNAQEQATWQFASDPGFGIGSADLLSGGALKFALRCRGSAAPVSPNSYVTADPRLGVATLLMPPNLFPAGGAEPVNVTLSVDNNFSMRFPAVIGKPEGAYAARFLLNGPLMSRMQSGQSMNLSVAGGQSITVGLAGSAPVLGQLRQFCVPSIAQQALIPQPGFACDRARTGVELTICSFPDLADADRRMAQLYGAAQQQGRLDTGAHTAWIANREQCGGDAGCILERTNSRITELNGGALPSGAAGQVQIATPQPAQQSVPAAPQPENTLQLQTAAPVAAPNAPPVVGREAVSKALLVWLFGQRPALLSNPDQLSQYRGVEFPPGAPFLDRRGWTDRNNRILWGQQMAGFARTQAFPQNVIIDLRAQIYRPQDGQPFALNLSDLGSRNTLIRELPIQLAGNRNAFRFLATNPYEVELPDAIKQGAGAEPGGNGRSYTTTGEMLLRLHLTLQPPKVNLPLDAQTIALSGGQTAAANGRMTIRQIELIKKQRANRNQNQGQPEQLFLLHRWEVPQTLPPISIDPLDSVEKTVAFYGGAVQGGRMIRFSRRVAQEMQMALPEGSFRGQNTGSDQSPEAEFALRLGTVLQSGGARRMSPDLTQQAAFSMLNVMERDQVLPADFANQSRRGSLNELERAQALRGAEEKMRQIVQARMPATPLKISAIILGQLGEYDIGLQGFPLQMNLGEAQWLQGTNLRAILPDQQPPDFIPVPEAQALTLLQQLDIDNLNGRAVPIRVDYTIAGALSEAQGSAPITTRDLQQVRLGYAVERIVVFSDTSFSNALLDTPYPEAEAQLSRFTRFAALLKQSPDTAEPGTPEAVFFELRDTGPESLLAPFVARGQNEQAQAYLSAVLGLRGSQLTSELQRIGALVQEGYWMLGEGVPFYDSVPELASLEEMRFAPFVNDPQRRSQRYLPSSALPARPRDMQFKLAPETYQAISEKLRQGFILAAKMPIQVQSRNQMTLGRPVALAVLPQGVRSGRPVLPELVVQLEAPEPFKAPPAGEVIPPKSLFLDHEGVDLLALSQDPEIYGDAGLERMLIERAARERQARTDGRQADWGAFFADPFIPLEPATRAALLPSFKEWTQKRIDALPETLTVPVSTQRQVHPHTGCSDVFELRAGQLQGRAVSDRYDLLFGGEAAALKANFGQQSYSQKPLPGGDRVFALSARPVLTGGSRQPHCPYLTERTARDAPPLLEGFAVGAAPYVDAVFVARGVPQPGQQPRQAVAVNYTLPRADVTLQDVQRSANDAAGFKGVLKLDGRVNEAVLWAQNQNRVPEVMATLTEDDWNAALGQRLDSAALDIVGLKLGMSEAEFLEKIEGRMSDGVAFASQPTVRPNIFSHAVGRIDPLKGEVIAAITAEASEGKPVLGVMRVRDFAPGQATILALIDLLQEKYGQPNVRDQNGQMLSWGVPVQELDPRGVCGGRGLYQGGRGPQVTFATDATQQQSRSLQSGILGSYGWPQAEIDPNAATALQYCGPSVTARIQEVGQGGLRLITWLFDRSAATALAKEAEDAARDAKPDLDL